MKAQFLQQQAGSAQLLVTLEGAAAGDAPVLVVQRSSDQCFMGQGGMGAWTLKEEEVSLPVEARGDELVFRMGPEYVNYLEPGNYQIRLRSGGAEVGKARMKIDNVQTQALNGSGAMQAQPDRAAMAAPVEEKPAAPVEQPVVQPAPQAVPAEESGPLAMTAATPASKSKLSLLLAMLLLLAVAGGLGYYFYQQHEAAQITEQRLAAEQQTAAEASRKAEEERLAAEAARKAEEERLAAEAAAKAEQERKAAEEAARLEADRLGKRADARGRARAFFASDDKTPKGAYELTQDVDTATDEQKDAVFRLLYYAANGDYAPAYMPYAACLDPTTDKWGTLEKDPVEAWQFYMKANSAEGKAAADKVMEWVKQQPAGNAQTRQWLQQMQQQ